MARCTCTYPTVKNHSPPSSLSCRGKMLVYHILHFGRGVFGRKPDTSAKSSET